MPIRNSNRERRRERIQQLIDEMSPPTIEPIPPVVGVETAIKEAEVRQASHPTFQPQAPQPTVGHAKSPAEETSVAPVSLSLPEELWQSPETPHPPITINPVPMSPKMPDREVDPELWWKEKQRRMSYDSSHWEGIPGLKPTSRSSGQEDYRPPGGTPAWIRGMGVRIVIAAFLFAGLWGWTKLELPGSEEAHEWIIQSVTEDIDFEAVEAWYSQTFGGSPSFLSFGKDGVKTAEVVAPLNPKQTVSPVHGTVVQTYEQNGSGVKVAAHSGSDVVALYEGRVYQVQADDKGGVTVLVQHSDRVLSVYGNLTKASVKVNDWVEAGQTLGILGDANGSSDPSVLYFAMQQNGVKLNPMDVVSFD